MEEMRKNKIKEALKVRNLALGTWIQTFNHTACEAAAIAGFDFVIIDAEYGALGIEDALKLVRTAESQGIASIIRTQDDWYAGISMVLGTGTDGILIPDVRTGEQVSRIVQGAKFGLTGRGACPFIRSAKYGALDWKAHADWSNRNTMVWVLIENTDAVRNIDSILATGIDAIMLGPYDLSMSMGLNGDTNHPDVIKALARVTQAASNKGVEVVAVLLESDPEQLLESAKLWRTKGSRIISALSDGWCLFANYKKAVDKLREV